MPKGDSGAATGAQWLLPYPHPKKSWNTLGSSPRLGVWEWGLCGDSRLSSSYQHMMANPLGSLVAWSP